METRELNKDELIVLLNLQLAKPEDVDKLYEAMKEETHVLEAIDKRSKAYHYEIDKKAQIMILTYSDGIIGVAANYVDHIRKWCGMNKRMKVSFNDLNMRIFPDGAVVKF